MQLYFMWVLLGVAALALLTATVLSMRKDDAERDVQRMKILQEQEARSKASICDLQQGLADCLDQLELPQLAEEKKRQEIAHQLSIVMIATLAPWHARRCSPNPIHIDRPYH